MLIIGAIWKAESNATSIAKLVETLDKDCDKVKKKKKSGGGVLLMELVLSQCTFCFI